MKPLVRWTIGNVRDEGFEMLKESVRLFKKIHNEFDFVVCYNEISNESLPKDINLFFQTHDCCAIPIKPNSTNAWKLFPPRLRFDSHEIFIDNDMIICNKIPQIVEFLKSDKPLCYGRYDERPFPYGSFAKLFKKSSEPQFKLNSGIFGLPPNYDFEKDLIENIFKLQLNEWGYFDEQGLVATCLMHKNPILINTEEISNCWKSFKFGRYGFHFCGHNAEELDAWKAYKRKSVLF